MTDAPLIIAFIEAAIIGALVLLLARRRRVERRLPADENAVALETGHREIQHLAGRLIEAQDAERARVARDLHDDVSQQIAGISIALSALKRRIAGVTAGEDLQQEIVALQQRAGMLADNVRHVSHDLHPTVLEHAGLDVALSAFCRELERVHGMPITCSAQGDFTVLAPESALCLYRVAQEALRNVTAHAGATRADVRLVNSGDVTELRVIDDGDGFEIGEFPRRGKGLGLVSITERVRLAGGTVSFVTELQKGTRVVVKVQSRVSRAAAR